MCDKYNAFRHLLLENEASKNYTVRTIRYKCIFKINCAMVFEIFFVETITSVC